jgi:anthranilate phosphoribosyltransferase
MQLDELINQVESNHDLDKSAAGWLMAQMMDGNLPSESVKRMILALKEKGETPQEVLGFVDVMLERTTPVEISAPCLDIVGTGGDQLNSANISTTAAIIAAGAGALVVKHGNRAASSKAGSADVLESLEIKLALDAKQVAQCVAEVGIGFCFAPQFHPAMKKVAAIRKEIGQATVFNILGPLANPANPGAMMVGVADPNRANLIANVLHSRGVDGFVAHGKDGLDEITVTAETQIWQFGELEIKQSVLDPAQFGVEKYPPHLLTGGDAKENAELLRKTLDPSEQSENVVAIRAAAVLNAAAGLLAFWIKSDGHTSNLEEIHWRNAIMECNLAIESGAAAKKLAKWQQFCAEI